MQARADEANISKIVGEPFKIQFGRRVGNRVTMALIFNGFPSVVITLLISGDLFSELMEAINSGRQIRTA